MDELTPEEQAELQQRLKAHQATIGPSNPDARRVEVPNDANLAFAQGSKDFIKRAMTPSAQRGEPTPAEQGQLHTIIGGTMGATGGMDNAVAAPARAVGGKLAGLSGEQVGAYQAAPNTIEALVKAPELRQQQFAERALGSTADKLGKRAGALSEELQGQFAGKSVPENEIRTTSQFRPGRGSLGDLSGEGIPVSEVYSKAQEAGKASKFAPNPIDPLAEKARAEAAGQEFATLRGAVSKAVPEADSTIEDIRQGIEAQQGLKSGANKPIAFLKSQASDTGAARQLADQVAGSTRLERTAGQFQTAAELGKTPDKITDRLLKPVGKGILRSSAKIGDKPANLGSFIGGRLQTNLAPGLAGRGSGEPEAQDELTPEEQAELALRLKQAR